MITSSFAVVEYDKRFALQMSVTDAVDAGF
jgi:hypothetical protein